MYSNSSLCRAVVLVLLASPLLGQNFPLPQCPAPAPLTFAGRYHDSTLIREIQTPPRTFRADEFLVAAERDRLYAKLGAGTFANYQLSAFINQVGGPLARVAPDRELYLPPRVLVMAEDPRSGWKTKLVDGQDRLIGFDYDDRGFVYLGYGPYGFGIVDDNGQLQSQIEGLAGLVLGVRSGSTYYAILPGSTSSIVYDVTNHRAPVRLPTFATGFRRFAKTAAGDVVAVARLTDVRLYTPANLVSAGEPITTFSLPVGESYADVTSDGVNFYAAGSTGSPSFQMFIDVFSLTADGTYSRRRHLGGVNFLPNRVTFGAGYLAVTGSFFNWDLRLFSLEGATPVPVPLGNYFEANYRGNNIFFDQAQVVLVNGTRYLILAANAIGDVYIVGDPTANLFISKTGPGTLVAGTNVTYQVTISNMGTAPATNVVMTDSLANMSFVSATSDAGITCTSTDGQARCTMAVLAPCASANVTITARVNSSVSGSHTNTATVSSGSPDPAPGGNKSTTAAQVTAEANLSIAKNVTTPGPYGAGKPVTYTIVVTNAGPSDAPSVAVVDGLPAGSQFLSAIPSQGTCTGSDTVNCQLGTVAAGATATLTLTIRTPDVPGTVTNTATVSSPADGTENPPATATIQTVVEANLSITKTALGTGPHFAGFPVTYQINVTNAGPSDAADVVVTDTLPPDSTFISALPSQGSCSGTTIVTCNLGTLSAGGSVVITLAVRSPETAGTVTNTATVSSPTDPTPNQPATASVQTIVAIPTLSEWVTLLLIAALAITGAVITTGRS